MTDPQEDTILIRTAIGCYDLIRPREESVSVYVRVPGFKTLNLHLSPDRAAHLDTDYTPWNRLVVDALDIYIEQTWVASDLPEAKRLREWAKEDDNDTLLWGAWARHRLPYLQRARDSLDGEICKINRGLEVVRG